MELLLTVALIGIVGSAIVSSLLVMLRTKESTSTSLDASRDKQFLNTYFTEDVAGAQSANSTGSQACGSTTGHVVTFVGTDFEPSEDPAISNDGVMTRVTWTYGNQRITRTACRGAAPADIRVIAKDVPIAPTLGSNCRDSNQGFTPTLPDIGLRVSATNETAAFVCGTRRVTLP